MSNEECCALVKKSVDGDIISFEKLIEFHYQLLHRYIACKVSDSFEAENILQEVLLSAWLNISKLKRAEAFKSWLAMIACNQSKKYYKQKEKTIQPTEDNTLFYLIDKHRVSESVSSFDYLSEQINKLPKKQKQTITDFYLNSLKIKEISFIRGVPQGTVKRRLHDARFNLKKRLEQNNE